MDRRLLFVTGKGGVGKTTVAAGLALAAAQQGKRVLLCDAEGSQDVAAAYECGDLSFEPRRLEGGLWLMAMDTEEALREYLRIYLRVPVVGKLGPLAKAFDFVATAAPGVREILVVGKLCWEAQNGPWDLVVADAAASGHVVSQLASAASISELVSSGPIRQQTGWMNELLADSARSAAVVVTTPEEMPVNEAVELAGRLAKETPLRLGAVVANRVLPELFGRGEEEVFEALSAGGAQDLLHRELGPGVDAAFSLARLAVALRRGGAVHLQRLRDALGDSVPVLYIPYLFTRSSGMRATRQVAAAIAAELGIG